MTDRYALFGNPLGHSKSPLIHNGFAKVTGEDVEYGLIEAPLDGFAKAALAFRDSGGNGEAKGCNITTPFKLDAFALATDKMERAAQSGAVNCLKFEPDGRILAEMFDGVGLANDVETNLGVSMRGKRVLLLGAGGAARGSLAAFLGRGPSEVVVANRTADKATALATEFSAQGKVTGCGYADLGKGERFDLVFNATSASLKGELPAVDASVFQRTALAYELAYGKGLTPFLRLAQNAGVPQLADGVGMLVEQAAEAWVWWRNVRPETRAVIDKLAVPLK
jgi:shikimate dehydrogenase